MPSFTDYGSISPRRYHIGTVHARSELLNWTDSTIVNLTLATPVLTLDFGHEVAGFPYIITQSQSTTAQIEFKYAESFASLESPYSDGPWTFSNGLSNSFRVETFDITQPGRLESFFVQGGQRWMVVTLLTSEDLTIHDVGFRATSPNMDFDKLPGQLNTSNELLDQVFHLGGRVAQAACVDAGNAPSTWEITSQGALVNGQTSAQSALGLLESNYTLTFDTKIVRGGTGWRVASAIEPLGPYFVLTSDYPENNTFINTNRTLMPPNTLIFNSDWGLVNQSTLETTANQYYPVNITIKEETWYRISTSIREAGYEISLDGNLIAFVPIPPPVPPISFFATPSRYQGTWGFGGFQEHITYYKDVNVVLGNGTEIYRNPFISDEALAEYNVAPLDTSLCLDGAKRDRLVWTGDFYHTVRVVAQSTARFDQLLGTIRYVFSYRNEDDASPFAGFVPISPRMGSRPRYYKTDQSWGGLVDYQDLLLAGIGEYFRYTGDLEGLRELWPQIKKLAFTKLTFINPTSGLVAGNANTPGVAWFLGPANGSAITGLFAFALDRLVPLANAFQDNEAATAYTKAAGDLRESINKNLWNEELGTYALSIASPGNFSLTGIAWAILSGAANATQIESSIGKLEELRFGVGYKTISSDAETPNYQLAPNPSGFLLEALFQSRRDHGSNSTTAITHLLDNLWGSMVNNDEYASGASWEYVKPDGSPGIDLFTSLAHPWGAAPTYVLPEYLLGVQPTSPGYATFALRPMIGYLGIKEVNGKVPTPKGPIEVGWKIEGHSVSLLVIVPSGVSGVLEFPNSCAVRSSGSVELSEGTKTMVFDLDSDI
jgi:hypothetical protein